MNRRACVFSFVVLAVAAAGAAQPPQPPPPTGTATVRGRIVGADSSKPLKRARVSFVSLDFGGPARSTTTDVNGRYEIKNLPAGRYTVTTARSGYLSLRYGQRRPLETARPVQVKDGQTLDAIDFSLPRSGVLSGRVFDEVGDVVAGVTVFVMRTEFWQGRRQLVPAVAAARTDDAGQYRVIGLAPGAYVIRATTRETWTVTRNGTKDVMSFLPTFFPGTPDVSVARRVTVGLGQQVGGIDFQLVPGKTVTVSGRAVDSHGRPLANVTLSQATTGPNGGQTGSGGGGQVSADGTFSLKDVTPGEYTLIAAGSNEVARLPLTVTAAGADNLSLVGSPGWSVTGTVTTDSGAPPSVPANRVRLSANMLTAIFGFRVQGEPDYRQKLDDDWTFSLGGITGSARFRVALPDGWAVKSILYKGRDLVDEAVEGDPDEPMTGVEIVLTNRVATVTGQLADSRGTPIDGTIVVFPTDNAKWFDGSRFIRAARPDQQGQFNIGNLPAGEYFAVAVDYMQDGVWNDPEYLESIRRLAERFTLAEGSTRTLTPKLVTP